jgi:hypothetical protein
MAHVGPDTRWHRYGAAAVVESIPTPYGRFLRCQPCTAAGHMDMEPSRVIAWGNLTVYPRPAGQGGWWAVADGVAWVWLEAGR